MADIEAGINSTANPRASMPPAPQHQQIECEPHFLDLMLVIQGNEDLGIAPGRKLEVMRWHNTTKAVLQAGRVKVADDDQDGEELYIVSRTLGGFIWVPKTGTPPLVTLINQVVGRSGGPRIYKDVVNRGIRDGSATRGSVSIGSKPPTTKPRAETYELWAVPAATHEHRVIAPGDGAAAIHQLFPK